LPDPPLPPKFAEETPGGEVLADDAPGPVDSEVLRSAIWIKDKHGNWDFREVEPLVELLRTGSTESAFWGRLFDEKREFLAALVSHDDDELWDRVDQLLMHEEYPEKDIQDLRKILEAEGVLDLRTEMEQVLEHLPEGAESLDDVSWDRALAGAMSSAKATANGQKKSPEPAVTAEQQRGDSFLCGTGAPPARKADTRMAAVSELLRMRSARTRMDGVMAADAAHAHPVLGFYHDYRTSCGCGHPHLRQGHCKTAAGGEGGTPEFADPKRYESREQWQKELQKSKGITPDGKRYIKQIENLVVDHWEDGFDGIWSQVEEVIDRGLPVTQDVLVELLTKGFQDQVRGLDDAEFRDAFMGVYHNGKEWAYQPTKYKQKKLRRLEGSRAVLPRTAVTIDDREEQEVLRRITDTALQKVKTITDPSIRQEILDTLTEPGAFGENPAKLADDIARKIRQKNEQEAADDKVKLRESLRDLYDNQLWKLQRITRTETVNGYTIATLRGFLEQGITKARWNAHKDDSRTCPFCLSIDGVVFEIDWVLTQDPVMPHSSLSHPNCRCWWTPVIESMKTEQLTQSEVVVSTTSGGTELRSIPVEDLPSTKEIVEQILEGKYKPPAIQYVDDVGKLDVFQQATSTTKSPLLGQVVTWTAPDSTVYVSQFGTREHEVDSLLVREWARKIWDGEDAIRGTFTDLFERTPERDVPADLEPSTVKTITEAVVAPEVAREVLVGPMEGMALGKRFREQEDDAVRDQLKGLGVSKADIDTIVRWRSEFPTWTWDGKFIERADAAAHAPYVNALAADNPEAYFTESAVAYVTNPGRLFSRDPSLYDALKRDVFSRKEFMGGHRGEG
jgi:SPP1 gp7 family putative phage head morphogenesis protein